MNDAVCDPQALEPQVMQIAEDYRSESRHLRERLAAKEEMVAEYERHAMQLRDRLLKVSFPHEMQNPLSCRALCQA